MSTVNGLRSLARDALGSAKKRRQISRFLKNSGLISLGKGSWLGHRGKDVVSGFIIEGSPLDTYITCFLLPSYDEHSFITWALGNRIVNCIIDGDTSDECEKAVDYYLKNIFAIKSPHDLIEYIDKKNIKGNYAIWAKYISYARMCDFDAAANYLDDEKRAQLHVTQLKKLDEIGPFISAHDKEGVFRVFKEWSAFSEKIFGPPHHPFNAALPGTEAATPQ